MSTLHETFRETSLGCSLTSEIITRCIRNLKILQESRKRPRGRWSHDTENSQWLFLVSRIGPQEAGQYFTCLPSIFLESLRTWRFLTHLVMVSDGREYPREASLRVSWRLNLRKQVKTPPVLWISSWLLGGRGAVLPRIFGLFEYSNNWAWIIVFVFAFAEFSNSEYYSNIRIIDPNTTNTSLVYLQ